MNPGEGYVIQLGGTLPVGTNTNIFDVIQNFSGGSLNNGDINSPVTGNSFNILGNPYNNFLDLDSFLLHPNNVSKLSGKIYLWAHNTILRPITASAFIYSGNDYAIYTVLGGVAAGRSIAPAAENGSVTGIQTPNGRLCFGTGFGVAGTSTGTVTFTNDMRTSDNAGANQSFKSNEATTIVTPPERHRVWVNLERGTIPNSGQNTNPLKQILVGYSDCYVNGVVTECATNGANDRVFDADIITISDPDAQPVVSFYSIATGTSNKLAIQGRNTTSFNANDFFQLGYTLLDTPQNPANLPATYTFTANADGMFATGGANYFISDNGMIHNFPYTTTLTTLTDNTRFKIVFTAPNLTQLTSHDCNSILPFFGGQGGTPAINNGYVDANSITGATMYEFEIKNTLTNQTVYYQNTSAQFLFENVAPIINDPNPMNHFILYNTLYNIRVRSLKNGIWSPFGIQCNITTPPFPITQIESQFCNVIINQPNTSILAANVQSQTLPFVCNYRFRLTRVSDGFVLPTWTGSNCFRSVQIRAQRFPGLQANTQYIVNVAMVVNGIEGPYGSNCLITTGSTIQNKNSDESNEEYFNVISNPNPFSNYFELNFQTDSDEIIYIKAYDMVGKLVENIITDVNSLNTLKLGNNYNIGFYIINIQQGEKSESLKVIKQ